MLVVLLLLGLQKSGFGAGAGADELQFQQLLRIPGTVLVYGGERHNVFLGCLNCQPSDRDSIDNQNGEHGSRTGEYSIRNPQGKYGDKLISDFSPCNRSAKYPPMITDKDGHQYGTLTLNSSDPDQRFHIAIDSWLRNEVCAGVYKK